ncbi:MAG: creatininase family protein, partial [Candidatus Limnocylindria bacterium]
MTQPLASEALAASRTALVVVGSVEQHGPHLPLGTDAFAAQAVAERTAERLGAPILLLSLIGIAPYHLSWPGSLTLRPATLIALLVDACRGLHSAGADRILLVNWHEGNTPTLRIGADEVQRTVGCRVAIAETHVITNQLFPDEMEFTHAGSMETAGVLAYDESLVRLDLIADAPEQSAGERGVASAGPQNEDGVASAGPQNEDGVASAGPQNEDGVASA